MQGNRVNHYGQTLLPPKRVTNHPDEFDLWDNISSSSIAIPTNVIYGQQATFQNVHCFGGLFEFHKNKRYIYRKHLQYTVHAIGMATTAYTKRVPRSRLLAYQQTLFDKPTMLYTSNRSTILLSRLFHHQLVRNDLFKSIHGFGRWVFCRSPDDEYRSNPPFLYLPKSSIPTNFITSHKLNKFVLLREHSHHGRRRRRGRRINRYCFLT